MGRTGPETRMPGITDQSRTMRKRVWGPRAFPRACFPALLFPTQSMEAPKHPHWSSDTKPSEEHWWADQTGLDLWPYLPYPPTTGRIFHSPLKISHRVHFTPFFFKQQNQQCSSKYLMSSFYSKVCLLSTWIPSAARRESEHVNIYHNYILPFTFTYTI